MSTEKPALALAEQNPGEIPDANPIMDELPDEAPPLVIGAPFAISHDCDLMDAQEGPPGCCAVLRCDCGQVFRFNLLLAGPKRCPKCRQAFTHMLLIAKAEDTEIVGEAMAQVLGANGYSVPARDDLEGDEDDEDDEDEDEDEGEGEGDNEG